MIIAYSAAFAEYIEHIFYFQCMIVWLTDCMIGPKHTILVLVIVFGLDSMCFLIALVWDIALVLDGINLGSLLGWIVFGTR